MSKSVNFDALKWFAAQGGDGVFSGSGNTLLARGEIAPFCRSTWNKLCALGYVEEYTPRPHPRLRLTELGKKMVSA